MSTQLTDLETFNPTNLVFETLRKNNFKDKEGKPVETKSMDINMRYPNGSKGPLIFQLPRCDTRCLSAQVGEGLEKTFSVFLSEGETVTAEHKHVMNVINQIIQACTKHCLTDDVKAKLGKWELEASDFKRLNPIEYQKERDTKKPYLDKPQVMYLKLMTKFSKELGMKVSDSRFYNEGEFDANGNPVELDYTEFIGKSGTCVPLIKIEKIFFGAVYKLHVKMYQCDVKVSDGGFKSLIKRAPPTVIRTSGTAATANNNLASYLDDDVDEDMHTDEAPAGEAPAEDVETEEQPQVDDDVEEVQTHERARSPSPPPAKKSNTTARRTGKK